MTCNHQDDATLIVALDRAQTQSRASPVPSDELMTPIIESIESHSKFRSELTRHIGPKLLWFNPRSQAYNLLTIAGERGGSGAVAWCHKLYSTERADLRYVSLVYGLRIEQPRKLSNGVSLMPLVNLPPSANADEVRSQFQEVCRDITTRVPIAATFEVSEGARPEGSSFDVTSRPLPRIDSYQTASLIL